MSSPFPPKPPTFPLKKLSAALISAMMFSGAHAAGWGELSVLSALGQPLRAEIELVSASRQDDGPLTVRLASFDAYRQANVEFNPILTSLRFAVEQRGDRQVVRVTSTQPVNEPFVDMLVELRSGSGRVVREYVFLLDPAGTGEVTAATVATVASTVAPLPSESLPANVRTGGSAKDARPAPSAASRSANVRPAAPSKPAAVPPAPASDARPKLTLSGVKAVSVNDPSQSVGLEEYAAMEKAVAEANARVKALEQKVADLQKLLEVTNGLLAEMQKQNELVRAGALQAAPPAPAVSAPPVQEKQVPEVPAPVQAAAASTAPAPAARPAPPPQAAEPDWTESLMLPGSALLALLASLGLFAARRRKARATAGSGLFADLQHDKAGNAANAPASAAAAGAASLLSAVHGHANEADALAEADVYIAYGRDIQAEEILKEALRVRPEKHAVRVKLLSIYAGRRDKESFAELARELLAMTGAEGEDWQQAAALGREIDPANPLYAERAAPVRSTAASSAPVMPVMSATSAVSAASPASSPEPVADLVLERLDEPEQDAMPAIAAPAERQVVPLQDLTPTEEITPVALDDTPLQDLDFDALLAPAAETLMTPAAAETPQAGTGPIDFEFLDPVPEPERRADAAPAIPELPALPEAPPEEASLLDFDFLKPDFAGKMDDTVPELPAPALEEPARVPVLLDLDFLETVEKSEKPAGR